MNDSTVFELILKAENRLKQVGVENPDIDARHLASKALNTSLGALVLHWNEPANNEFIQRFEELLKRREKREPLQYILGSWGFGELTLNVAQGALIPRPETEELLYAVVKILKQSKATEKFLFAEPCTGTAAIALTLSTIFPKSLGIASDISPPAIKIAASNLKKYNLDNIFLLKSDMLSHLMTNSVDLVICNPPYVSSDELDSLMPEVRNYEPRIALDGGKDGLDLIKTLVLQSKRVLKPRGILAFEHAHKQRESIFILLKSGWKIIQAADDYSGLERLIIASKL